MVAKLPHGWFHEAYGRLALYKGGMRMGQVRAGFDIGTWHVEVEDGKVATYDNPDEAMEHLEARSGMQP